MVKNDLEILDGSRFSDHYGKQDLCRGSSFAESQTLGKAPFAESQGGL
jgi:hypothetical protein